MKLKTIQSSFVQYHATVEPQDLNRYGIMHGGRLLTLCDEIGYLAARKHAECDCLTRAAHQVQFLSMLKEREPFTIESRVVLCGNTTLWTECLVKRDEKVGDGEAVMRSLFVYIAVDKAMKPLSVPPIHAKDESEQTLQAQLQHFRDRVLKE